jgi:hypothetical protein
LLDGKLTEEGIMEFTEQKIVEAVKRVIEEHQTIGHSAREIGTPGTRKQILVQPENGLLGDF